MLITSFLVKAVRAKRVDINITDIATLAETMVGVDSTLATTFIGRRANFGTFENIYELAKGNGISVVLIKKNRDLIAIDTILGSDC